MEFDSAGGSPELQERYSRWQKIAIDQLSYTLNLLLTLAVAELGFAVKVAIDATRPFPQAASDRSAMRFTRWRRQLRLRCSPRLREP